MRIVLLSLAILLMVSAFDAHAYLDPGTGSYVLQIIIAGIVSSAFAIKMCWRRIVAFFSQLFGGKK